MSSRPDLFQLPTWADHEQRVQEVVAGALRLLRAEPALPECEDDLNRMLYFLLIRENRRLLKLGRGTCSTIMFECNNQPSQADVVRAARENKRPDFTCGFIDLQADADRFLVLECKRLGEPTSGNWVLTRNYIAHGALRFVTPEWGYGQDASSGLMIGYVQTMTPDAALLQVNGHAREAGIAELSPIGKNPRPDDVTVMQQMLTRDFSITPFTVRHAWIDLRVTARPDSRGIVVPPVSSPTT